MSYEGSAASGVDGGRIEGFGQGLGAAECVCGDVTIIQVEEWGVGGVREEGGGAGEWTEGGGAWHGQVEDENVINAPRHILELGWEGHGVLSHAPGTLPGGTPPLA